MPLPKQSDYAFQLDFVVRNAFRLISLQDVQPLSPTYGCFHYAYWRDKTSEFPDARMQEAGATLGLLALPRYDSLRAEGLLPEKEVLYQAFQAGLYNLEQQQYPEGCFDEWYKGERGFAATEFTSIAYGLAGYFLDDALLTKDRKRLQKVLLQAGRWLSQRHDRIKANHEMAAAAALALIWHHTQKPEMKQAADNAFEDTLQRVTAEDWYPEIGGMDLGYCSVLLDYAMIYAHITKAHARVIEPMIRLFEFMQPHIHPDGTISPEAGLCLNPYVSRLGMGLLSAYHPPAGALVTLWNQQNSGHSGLAATLTDDLRFCRWSHLPVVTDLLYDLFSPSKSAGLTYPQGWTQHKQANILAWHHQSHHLYFSVAGGGQVRLFQGEKLIFEDLGPRTTPDSNQKCWGSSGYNARRVVTRTSEQAVVMESSLNEAQFFFPGFISRLILRLGCAFSWSSRLIRALIDFQRKRKGSAVNQSVAPIAQGESPWSFNRTILPEATGFVLRDEICNTTHFNPAHLVIMAHHEGQSRTFSLPEKQHAVKIIINKKIDLSCTPSTLTFESQIS
ncbi:hypothetical protein ACQZV8_02390 [Magnetococcales bacterium HHB-1]